MPVPLAPPPPPPPLPLPEQASLLEKQITELDEKRALLEAETGALASEEKQIEDSLVPILKAEQESRATLRAIELREAGAKEKNDRRKAEQERWEEEQKRRIIEVERLKIKEQIEKTLNSIKEKEAAHKSIIDEESALKKIHDLEIEQKRIDLNVKLQEIVHKRGDAESKLSDITKEKTRIETLLKDTQAKEKMIEGSEHETEQRMISAQTFKEEEALAQTRAGLEKERHDIEEARWKAEDEAEMLGLSSDESAKALADIKKQEAELIEKIKSFK
jgi:hypothetical protein